MSCLGFLEKMSRCLDGALSVSEKQALQEHLEKCENCRRQWAILQQLDLILSSASSAIPSVDFVSNVNLRLDELSIGRDKSSKSARTGVYILLCLGAIAFLVLSVVSGAISDLMTGETVLTAAVRGLDLSVSVINLIWGMTTAVWDYASSTSNQLFVAGYTAASLVLTILWVRMVSSLTGTREREITNGLS